MCNFFSRVSGSQKLSGPAMGAILDHQRMKDWRQKWKEATGEEATTDDLIAELDREIAEYNQTTEPRVVECESKSERAEAIDLAADIGLPFCDHYLAGLAR